MLEEARPPAYEVPGKGGWEYDAHASDCAQPEVGQKRPPHLARRWIPDTHRCALAEPCQAATPQAAEGGTRTASWQVPTPFPGTKRPHDYEHHQAAGPDPPGQCLGKQAEVCEAIERAEVGERAVVMG